MATIDGEVLPQGEPTQQQAEAIAPACAVEEWAQRFGIQDGVRLLLLLWAAPAVAMLVAAAGILTDESRLAGFDTAMVVSRAWFATLGVFVLLVGAMWFVRSAVPLPSYRVLGSDWSGWKLHAGAAGGAALLSVVAAGAGSVAWVVWILAAICGFLASSGLSRWMWSVPVPAAQPLAGFLMCAAFEMTVGWMWWQPVSTLGLVVLGVTTALRATAIVSCVLGSTYALAVGHWPPVVDSISTAVDRVTGA